MPKPRPNESQKSYIARCMADKRMNEKYPNRDQRYAVCISEWQSHHGQARSKKKKRKRRK